MSKDDKIRDIPNGKKKSQKEPIKIRCRDGIFLPFLIIFPSLILFLCIPSLAQPPTTQGQITAPGYLQGPLSVPADFSGDWYSVQGGPDLQAALVRSSVDRNEDTSLYLTLTNIGRVTSFKVVNEPVLDRPDEVFAAQKELQLEAQRAIAQDVSVRLTAQNSSAMKFKREVAYAGSLRDGQVSSILEFPVEVYENTMIGDYILYATINYTYQQDVAVKPHSDNPQNPDVFYWYNTASKIIPLTLKVEKKSLVDLIALNATPKTLDVGSKDNILKVFIKNQGNDTAKDLMARLRPEAGVYVDMDESPIPVLRPKETAQLTYKVDVSKDAVGGKPYRFTLLFDYSDSYRKNLQDSDNVYVSIEPSLAARYWWAAAIAVIILALAAIFMIRRRRSATGQ
jgi:hypothetical protein